VVGLAMMGWPTHDGFIVMGGERGFFPTHGPKAARERATPALVPAQTNSRSFPLVRMTRLWRDKLRVLSFCFAQGQDDKVRGWLR
jgi:hypothetical protein